MHQNQSMNSTYLDQSFYITDGETEAFTYSKTGTCQ